MIFAPTSQGLKLGGVYKGCVSTLGTNTCHPGPFLPPPLFKKIALVTECYLYPSPSQPEKLACTGRLRTISTSFCAMAGPRPCPFSAQTIRKEDPGGSNNGSTKNFRVPSWTPAEGFVWRENWGNHVF